MGSEFTVSCSVHEDGMTTPVADTSIVKVTSRQDLGASAPAVESLKSNTRYYVTLHVGDRNRPFAKNCFKTAMAQVDMNTPPPCDRDVRLFAIVDDHWRMTSRNKVIACLYGARNADNTQWARTDSTDGLHTSWTTLGDGKWTTPRTDRCLNGHIGGAACGPPLKYQRVLGDFQTDPLREFRKGHPSASQDRVPRSGTAHLPNRTGG